MFEKSTIEPDSGQVEFIPCPNVIGAFAVYGECLEHGGRLISGCLPCDRWDCPACGPRKKRSLWIRYQKGTISEKPSSVYGRKFLTLTAPGKEWRGKYTPEDAYTVMADHYAHLVRNLRSKYGHFDFMRVAEPQKDGYPHFHVLLVGDNIAPREILDDIEYFWRDTYRMGFVKLNKVSFKDGGHALNYILKYITKDVRGFGRYKRIFSASRGALARVEKTKWDSSRVVMGRANDTGVHMMPVSSEEFIELSSGFQADGQYRTIEGVMDQLLTIMMGQHAIET